MSTVKWKSRIYILRQDGRSTPAQRPTPTNFRSGSEQGFWHSLHVSNAQTKLQMFVVVYVFAPGRWSPCQKSKAVKKKKTKKYRKQTQPTAPWRSKLQISRRTSFPCVWDPWKKACRYFLQNAYWDNDVVQEGTKKKMTFPSFGKKWCLSIPNHADDWAVRVWWLKCSSPFQQCP